MPYITMENRIYLCMYGLETVYFAHICTHICAIGRSHDVCPATAALFREQQNI